MSYQLPTELKLQIIRHVDKKSLPVVLRVDSTFHAIGEPLLYHTVILAPFPYHSRLLGTATQCLNNLIRRPTAAAAVQCMGVDLSDWGHHSESALGAEEFFEALRTALPKVSNLVELEINNWDHTVRGKDSIGKLPRGCRFPTLQHYFGPPGFLDDIQSNTLKTLHIRSIGSSITPITRTYSAAARLSGQTLRLLNVSCSYEPQDNPTELRGWESAFMEIPSLFPNLRLLSFVSKHIVTFALLDKLIPNIARLPNLRLLRVSRNWEEIPFPEQELYVKHLHAGCPQLRAIILAGCDEWMFSERSQTWLGPTIPLSRSSINLLVEADWRKYLEDPVRDGFYYPILAIRQRDD